MRVAVRFIGVALGVMALLGACIIEPPVPDTAAGLQPNAPTPQSPPAPAPTAAEAIPPTAAPAPTAIPTPTAMATPAPLPTRAPEPIRPPPLVATDPEALRDPILIPAGPVAVPVADAQFMLARERPILQLPGHTLVYIDTDRLGEVDIFTPVADAAGVPLSSFDQVITHLTSDPIFASLNVLDPLTIGGLRAQAFEGDATISQRAFYTDLDTLALESAGWFTPLRMRLWVIDTPAGAVIVSAESLENPGQYPEAVRLAAEILSTIEFG